MYMDKLNSLENMSGFMHIVVMSGVVISYFTFGQYKHILHWEACTHSI